MARELSLETKIKRGYGQGEGKDYKPFIRANRFPSNGTCSIIPDWKTGRSVHCLSQGEAMAYYLLRWDDENIDIREQFPLWDEDFTNTPTRLIANQLCVTPPRGIMTTDFLVTRADGSLEAYSIKSNRNLSERTVQKLCIEMLYWNSRNVSYTLAFKEDINQTLATNIRLVTEFYNAGAVLPDDPISAIKHKIAIKEYDIDMAHEVITASMLKNLLAEGIYYGKIGTHLHKD